MALVIHGQALRSFHSSFANPDLSKRVGQFSRAGLELAACGNTMKSQNVARKDLHRDAPVDANMSRRSLI
jgi:intracellular sulfur oxidation DsrE/DsrF family protein